ncbi:MAG: NADH-quinone oxidoreductase subunit H [Candidatus Saganbacteria bacterium]|nr:NADH-quinone oxidoreductase subunit H [Candidatus Saganbacteria bacterium]
MFDILEVLFLYLVFPGFLFSAVVGLLSCWVDRKVTAKVQWRVGPPMLQPFIDIIKLLGKEVILPRGAYKFSFFFFPLLGLAGITLVSTMLWIFNVFPDKTFIGDLIVVLYLLMLPPLSLILAGFASKNPLATLGASREMKLMLSYELPFILAIFTIVAKSHSLLMGNMVTVQSTQGMYLLSASGIIAFIVALICIQAKLGFVPFDIADAEQEIAGGIIIEFSGALLAIYKLTKAIMLFVLPVFLITLFLGGINVFTLWGIAQFILKYVIILTLIVVIKNTNPRLRIDQALRFFWGKVTVLAVIAMVLALVGW